MKYPPTVSHRNRMAASRNGFNPACLNLSKVVSAPRAVIAIVSRKVSKELMPLVNAANASCGMKLADCRRELTTITRRNRNANHRRPNGSAESRPAMRSGWIIAVQVLLCRGSYRRNWTDWRITGSAYTRHWMAVCISTSKRAAILTSTIPIGNRTGPNQRICITPSVIIWESMASGWKRSMSK